MAEKLITHNNGEHRKWIKDYWICHQCATKHGGKSTEGVATAKIGQCKYCDEASIVLLPYLDFEWPNDPQLDLHCKRNRD